jgi:hypothetical protein
VVGARASESVARPRLAERAPLPWDGRQPNLLDPVEDRSQTLPPAGAPGRCAERALASSDRRRPDLRDPVDARWPSLPAPTAVDLEPEPVAEQARLRRLAREQQGVPWSEWPS